MDDPLYTVALNDGNGNYTDAPTSAETLDELLDLLVKPGMFLTILRTD
jgi:hypothetical protein